ncbi:hypothetical protein D9M71_482120 [compost metagenome]
MGDDDDGVLALQLVDQLLDLEGGDRIERRAGFVEQQHFRLHRHGTGDHQTLLLAAGETQRRVVQAVLDLVPQRGALQRPLHGLVEHAFLVDALQAQAVDHVLVDALGERVGLLEHHADAAAQLGDVDALGVDVVTVEADLAVDAAAVDQIVHAVEGAQQGRLAATGRADEGGDAVLRDVQADVEQRLLVAVEQVEAGHLEGHRLAGQVEGLLLAAEGADVDAVAVGFVLHGVCSTVNSGSPAGANTAGHCASVARACVGLSDPAPCTSRAVGCGCTPRSG